MSSHGGSQVNNLDVRFKIITETCALFEYKASRTKCVQTHLRTMNHTNIDFLEELAIRVDKSNPNHHLWNNNGTWWLHYTVYPTPVTSERRRKSLKTQCLEKARVKRDQALLQLA